MLKINKAKEKAALVDEDFVDEEVLTDTPSETPTAKVEVADPADGTMEAVAALIRQTGGNVPADDDEKAATPEEPEDPEVETVETTGEAPSPSAASDAPDETVAPAAFASHGGEGPARRPVSLDGLPEDEAKRRQEDEAKRRQAEMMQRMGGGGAGGIGAAIGGLFSSIGKGVASVGDGGRSLAKRLTDHDDPVSVAQRSFKQKYAGLNQSLKSVDRASGDYKQAIGDFNEAIRSSSEGQKLSSLAATTGLSLDQYMDGIAAGSIKNAEATEVISRLGHDPKVIGAFERMETAKKVVESGANDAQRNAKFLADNFPGKINPSFEGNRIVDALDKDYDKPLNMDVAPKPGNSDDLQAEEKKNSKKLHEEFMAMVDRMKELVMRVFEKVASVLTGGPKNG